jgi:hypothetical protein
VCDQFVLGWKKVSLTKSVERKRQSAVFVLFSFSCVCVCITSMRYAIQDNNNKPDCVSNVRVYWLDQVPDILSNERPTIKNQKPRLKKKKKYKTQKERKKKPPPNHDGESLLHRHPGSRMSAFPIFNYSAREL